MLNKKLKSENMNYFDLMAHLGASSIHPGGFEVTKILIKKINIRENSYVLDVGCGTGYTACYLAKKYKCKVVGIDISEEMIKKARERVKGHESNVKFIVANAENLPFDDNTFDFLIGESITIYLNKYKALGEYLRVIKPQGYIADIEFTWLKEPTQKIKDETSEVLGMKTDILRREEWINLMKEQGLKDPKSEIYDMSMNTLYLLKKIIDQKLAAIKMIYEVFSNPIIKKNSKEVKQHFKNYSEYFCYGIYTGRK